ncbi:probable disease resistance RPP8-like protein 4 [Salvia miltiorrhiza]|uniref:probable disease resistance RPP8-like protein 4 n=1 Tax=Salvia miltiorrhiza TaxID=226208 RepID=UPI0025ABC3D5|nr:probable disease resistance RPP8-like protein 4 [Salvia miltiorrhiza]
MADAAVEFLLENLKQLLLHHASLLKDAKDQVEKLENHLRLFKAFLKDAPKQWRDDEKLRELIRRIRNAVYEAEDIIDAYVTQAAEAKSKNYFLRAIQGPPKVISIANKVEAVLQKIDDIYKDKKNIIDFANIKVEDGAAHHQDEAPQVRETNVVGFEDEAYKLKGYLCRECEELEVISIVGMPGLGKTTLAGKIFRDPEIHYHFPTRIWVYVSQEFTKKDIFLAILKEFTGLTDDIRSKSDKELADAVAGYLDNGRFLLVMDDVWSCEDWDRLHIALPKCNARGKVLITSRQAEVGWHVNRRKGPHLLRFLTLEESILLLQLEVFQEPKFPPELEVEGRLIAERCDGLPLAIVVIGGILVRKFSGDTTAMKTTWQHVSQSFDTYLKDESAGKRLEKIILLSYEKLPYHLRECFLYLGMFPEDFEISVWKLTRLWIAEGLIQQKDVSLEETAENYVEELINRNLVRAEKFKPNGKVKTCRIHDMLRDFCLNEAGIKGEGFLQEIKMSSHGGFHPSAAEELKFRRLCIHSNVVSFVSRKPFGPSVRSFVCFSRDETTMPAGDISAIPGGFKLLRVLDAEPIKFTKLPSDMYQLLHLRYLVLSVSLKVLPAPFSKLWNIQTLVVETDARTLVIKADILNMTQLRHFKTNASAELAKVSKSSKGAGEKMQTLGTISPESCTEEVFDRARNLRQLGIRGKLALLLGDKNGAFEGLGNLSNLEKLKLINDVFPVPASGTVHLRGLPPAYKFPPKLKSLTLCETSLEWRHMSVIGSLDKLEVLKLKDKAFQGEIWEAHDGGFRHLEILHIGRTDLKIWVASHHHFPRLKHLELNNCEDLQQIPTELAQVPSFLKLDLFRSKRAAASARKIEAKIKQDNVVRHFRLSIFPPEA